MDFDPWDSENRQEQVLAPGAELIVDPVGRLQSLLDARIGAFAEPQRGA